MRLISSPNPTRAPARGFSLVEVMVALLILSVGLLGLAGLQVLGLKHTGNAYFRTQATLLASEMAERIHANPLAAVRGEYDFDAIDGGDQPRCDTPPRPLCAITEADQRDDPNYGCTTSAELAAFDLYLVNCGFPGDDSPLGGGTPAHRAGIDDLLPLGALRVACQGAPAVTCEVRVRWEEVLAEPRDVDGDGQPDNTIGREVAMSFAP